MSMPAPLAEVVSDFAEVEGQDKLKLLLEFADELPDLPPELEQQAMEPVPECQTRCSCTSTRATRTGCGCTSARPPNRRPRGVRVDPGHRPGRAAGRRDLAVPEDFTTTSGWPP